MEKGTYIFSIPLSDGVNTKLVQIEAFDELDAWTKLSMEIGTVRANGASLIEAPTSV